MRINKQICAFRGCHSSYRIRSRRRHQDPLNFIGRSIKPLLHIINRWLTKTRGFKMQLSLKLKLEKSDDQTARTFFNSSQFIVLPSTDINETLITAFTTILMRIDDFQQMGSGWVVTFVRRLDVHVSKYQPLRGSTFITLPNYIKNKRCVLNIQNNDNKCFVWSILAALYPVAHGKHPHRTTKYTDYLHQNQVAHMFNAYENNRYC